MTAAMRATGSLRLICIDDSPADVALAVRQLEGSGLVFSGVHVDSRGALLAALDEAPPDLVLSEFSLPGLSGLEALAIVQDRAPGIPFLMFTGTLSDETAVECLKAGAWDYVQKENPARLPYAVCDALEKKRARDKAEADRVALFESERRYRTLADTGQALIWTADATNGRQTFNQPWLDFTGRPLAQALGDGWLEQVHPDDRNLCRQVQEAAVRAPGSFTHVFRLKRHDGQYRSIKEVWTARFDRHGTFEGYIGHGLDITDLLHAEAERSRYAAALAQAQKMQAVGRLAGGVSHDFNNLLTGILGYCDLLLSSIPAAAPYRADVVQIQNVANRASTLTRQLLAFSRKQVMSPVALNLTTLLGDIEKPVRTMLRENLEIVWDLAPGLEDIYADPAQVEQALYNILMNASDAMPNGGRITVRTYAADLEATLVTRRGGTHKGRHVAVSVRDTGVGIDPSVLPLVFEPFVTTKPPGQGNGLGLAAVYGIVKQSHGYVIAENRPDEGATFTMFFPVVTGEPEVTLADEPDTVESPGDQTVLLVEDDEALRPVLRRVLEGRGYEVLEAVDGVDAVDRWLSQAFRVTVLLTDIVMPRRDGVELARLFREIAPSLHVLFMTAYADPEVFKDVVVDDRTALIRKPFLPSALVNSLRRLLQGRPAEAEVDS